MPTTLRQFIQDKANTSQDVTVGLIFSVAGTDGELYVLETDPLNPSLPTGITLSTVEAQYLRNGSATTPVYDTSTASNIRPLPVVLARDGANVDYGVGNAAATTIRSAEATLTPAGVAVNNNASTNITTAAYVQLIASTSATSRAIEISDTGGRWYYLAIGPAASEVDILVIPPGGLGPIGIQIAVGTRLSIKAIDGTANSGYVGVNIYG
jgi:hypothetical protein